MKLAFFLCAHWLCLLAAGARTPYVGIGIAVVNDGSTNRSYSSVHEYRSIRLADGSYGLMRTDGTKIAGLAAHIVARYEFANPPSKSNLAAMEAMARAYVKSRPILAPHIKAMKEDLRKIEFEADIAGGKPMKRPPIVVPEMKFGERIYRNIRVTSLLAGRLRFMHDEGTFSLPAATLTESFLIKVGMASPVIAASQDYQDLMATFVGPLEIADRTLTGVRMDWNDGGNASLTSDQGTLDVAISAISGTDLAMLEAAGERLCELTRSYRLAEDKLAFREASTFAGEEVDTRHIIREAKGLEHQFQDIIDFWENKHGDGMATQEP
ncbi:MAG: hypothetical protein RLZZ505_2502 [Verrucomicrobiota bacterium]|jgi:hypothetical protein